ncbi:hypothetical protein [Massilia yuzhufengensis]|uniref:hypothetical protein n=1 Tax=Massilia yuzhufengensis TaxID=1164594 RepID=UPI0015A6E5C4|nr:hypothetical protein [Massilia yuzhufengensis]
MLELYRLTPRIAIDMRRSAENKEQNAQGGDQPRTAAAIAPVSPTFGDERIS